jgi:hypothetical protein
LPRRDFIAEKSPKTNEERYAVILYYLQRVLSVENVNRDHVFTAFKDASIRVPKDIDGGLRKTGARKGWVNTEDKNDLRITITGENLVEHDLPRPEQES